MLVDDFQDSDFLEEVDEVDLRHVTELAHEIHLLRTTACGHIHLTHFLVEIWVSIGCETCEARIDEQLVERNECCEHVFLDARQPSGILAHTTVEVAVVAEAFCLVLKAVEAVGIERVLHVGRHHVVGHLGKAGPAEAICLVHVAELVGDGPCGEVVARHECIVDDSYRHVAVVVVGVHIAGALLARGHRLVIREVVFVLEQSQEFTFEAYHLVVLAHEQFALVRAFLLDVVHGEHAVYVLAAHVEAVALGIPQQAFPVGVGMSFEIRAEIALLHAVEEVNFHLRSLSPVVREIVDIAVTLMVDLDDVQTVAHAIAARSEHLRSEVADLQLDAVALDALNEHDDDVARIESDTRCILIVAVGEPHLELADERVRTLVGCEFAHAELRGIGAV